MRLSFPYQSTIDLSKYSIMAQKLNSNPIQHLQDVHGGLSLWPIKKDPTKALAGRSSIFGFLDKNEATKARDEVRPANGPALSPDQRRNSSSRTITEDLSLHGPTIQFFPDDQRRNSSRNLSSRTMAEHFPSRNSSEAEDSSPHGPQMIDLQQGPSESNPDLTKQIETPAKKGLTGLNLANTALLVANSTSKSAQEAKKGVLKAVQATKPLSTEMITKSVEQPTELPSVDRLSCSVPGWALHRCKAYFAALLVLGVMALIMYSIVRTIQNRTCRDRRKMMTLYVLAELIIGYGFIKLILPHLLPNRSHFTGKKAVIRRLTDMATQGNKTDRERFTRLILSTSFIARLLGWRLKKNNWSRKNRKRKSKRSTTNDLMMRSRRVWKPIVWKKNAIAIGEDKDLDHFFCA